MDLEQFERHVGLRNGIGRAFLKDALAERGEPGLLSFRGRDRGCQLFLRHL